MSTIETNPLEHQRQNPSKEHPNTLVERAVQAGFDEPGTIPETLDKLNEDLEALWPDSETGRYNRAKRQRQAAFSIASLETLRTALPRILDHYNQNDSLAVPLEFPYEDAQSVTVPTGTAYWNALRASSFWLNREGKDTWLAMHDEDHRMYRLIDYIDAAYGQHFERFTDWKAQPKNANRWPIRMDSIDLAKEMLIRPLTFNTLQGLNLASAHAIQSLLGDPDMSPADIADEMHAAIVPMSWRASANRHVGWVPHWQELDEAQYSIGAEKATETLATFMQDRDLAHLTAYAEPRAFMREPNLCPHRSLRDGPWTKAGACFGNVNVVFPENQDQANVEEFSKIFGLEPAPDKSINLTKVVLAMGCSVVETELLR
ncbi:MAG: hypothetical protein ACQR33_01995 [Candidatus Saccharibacteria bacterium]